MRLILWPAQPWLCRTVHCARQLCCGWSLPDCSQHGTGPLSDCRAVGEAWQCRPLWAAQCGRRRCAYASSLPCADRNKQPFLFASPKQTLKPAPDLLAENCTRPFGQPAVSVQMRRLSVSIKCQRSAAPLGPFSSFHFLRRCGSVQRKSGPVDNPAPAPRWGRDEKQQRSPGNGPGPACVWQSRELTLSGSSTPSYACSEGGRTVRHCCAAFRFGHSCRSDAHPLWNSQPLLSEVCGRRFPDGSASDSIGRPQYSDRLRCCGASCTAVAIVPTARS